MTDTDFNMLAFDIADQMRPLMDSIMDAGAMVELLPPCGIERTGDLTRHRPSTNEECAIGTADLVVPGLTFDVRKPIPNQVVNWLRTISAELVAAADQIDLIEDGRDLAAVKRLIRGK